MGNSCVRPTGAEKSLRRPVDERDEIPSRYGCPICARQRVSCRNQANGCEFFNVLVSEVLSHEERCQHRPVRCRVVSCYEKVLCRDIERHMADSHADMIGRENVGFDGV
jgi:hypothetical protein